MTEAVETKRMSVVGANTNEVEHTVAKFLGLKYDAVLSGGTVALQLAGVKDDDEVLCSDTTFKEGFKVLPVSMNPFDEKKSVPNNWLSCLIIAIRKLCVLRQETNIRQFRDRSMENPARLRYWKH